MNHTFHFSVRDSIHRPAYSLRGGGVLMSILTAVLFAFPVAAMAQQRPTAAKPLRPPPKSVNVDSNRKPLAVPMDFDGDRKSDFVFFRPSEGKWYIRQSKDGDKVVQFGEASDRFVPGDYDGDGKTDVAVFRPSEGKWYVRPSNGGQGIEMTWGEASDRLVPGDYDGDRKTDFAIFRPAEGKWHIRYASGSAVAIEYGDAADRLVPADYDGDGKTDPAVVRDCTWHIRASSPQTIAPALFLVPLLMSSRLVPADFDGDGKADLAAFVGDRQRVRDEFIGWHIRPSKGGSEQTTDYGELSDVLVPGDYDGDGKADLALFRSAEGTWYVKASGPVAMPPVKFGQPGDIILGMGPKPLYTRYNEVQQISSHNSYNIDDIKGDIPAQADDGVRSFEYDIHPSEWRSDWDVRHGSGDYGDHVKHLSEGLDKLNAWSSKHANHEVITLWIELCCDNWEAGHRPENLDECLRKYLGNKIFRPVDILAQAPGTTNLKDAVRQSGWPTLESLRGRFIIVLMGDADKQVAYYHTNYCGDYHVGYDGGNAAQLCFIAASDNVPGKALKGPEESWGNAIFYNVNQDEASDARFVWEHGYVCRIFGEGDSGLQSGGIEDRGDWNMAIRFNGHHLATNHVMNRHLFPDHLTDEGGGPFKLMGTPCPWKR